MGYVDGSNLDPVMAKRERELLLSGLSYTEIAAVIGQRVKTISERNRLIHKVDIWEAFERRIERDGVPDRLSVTDDFGYWFSGLFDGEGAITLFTRPATRRPQYAEYRMHIRIMLRDDDAQVIDRIHDNLKVGRVHRRKANGNINPTISWHCERVQDLAEVVIPLFDRYPLYSKKAKEYALWKPVVMRRYASTMAGYSNRRGIPEDERTAFHQALKTIADIRRYPDPASPVRITISEV